MLIRSASRSLETSVFYVIFPGSFLSRFFSSTVPEVLYTPTFGYCDVVWSGCTNDEAKRLETYLNLGCGLVLRKPHFYSATASRKELGLTTLPAGRKLHTCVIMFKCLHSLAPPYLSALFHAPSFRYITRSSCTHQINLPMARTSFGCKCFNLAGASTW